jgi:hypothetical protein
MKKIIIINYEYPPYKGGGATATKFISEELLKKGFDVTILTS